MFSLLAVCILLQTEGLQPFDDQFGMTELVIAVAAEPAPAVFEWSFGEAVAVVTITGRPTGMRRGFSRGLYLSRVLVEAPAGFRGVSGFHARAVATKSKPPTVANVMLQSSIALTPPTVGATAVSAVQPPTAPAPAVAAAAAAPAAGAGAGAGAAAGGGAVKGP